MDETRFPPGTPWGFSDLRMEKLAGQPPSGFDCGREAQNAFLYARAWRDVKAGLSVTHLMFIKGLFAGFATIIMDRIVLGHSEKPRGVTWRQVGALKIAQLAVDQRFAGHGVGKYLVAYVVAFARVLRSDVGCRFITLEAEPDVAGWYEAQGFRANLEEQASREERARASGRPVESLPVSMRFDLRELRR